MHLILKGVLGKDKEKILTQVGQAIDYFQQHPEFDRGEHGY